MEALARNMAAQDISANAFQIVMGTIVKLVPANN